MCQSTECRFEFELDTKHVVLVHDNPGDHLYKTWLDEGTFYELEFLEFLGSLLPPGSCVLDIGANVGNHTVYFAAMRGCTVVAMEPNQRAVRLLRRNLALNGVERRVRIIEAAAGEASGRADTLAPPVMTNLGEVAYRPSDAGEARIEPIDRLDLPENLGLIKIDTEGWELPILRGATEILRTRRPVVAAEIPGPVAYGEIFDFMRTRGYLVVNAFNWTPTHVFAPFDGAVSQQAEAASRRIGEHWIESLRRRDPPADRQAAHDQLIAELKRHL